MTSVSEVTVVQLVRGSSCCWYVSNAVISPSPSVGSRYMRFEVPPRKRTEPFSSLSSPILPDNSVSNVGKVVVVYAPSS